MIDPTLEAVFPFNVAEILGEVLPAIDEDVTLYKRPLRPTDPNYAISVYPTLWQPDEESYEFQGTGPLGPTLSNYQLGIQTLTKDGDTERCLLISSILTNRVRTVLYRNQPLRVALGSLYVTDGTFRESMRRWGMRSQRFMANDIEGSFVNISVLDFWIETETT